jgi:hypothetical protein
MAAAIMPEQTAQEPSMDEILASIRRIITDDDPPAEAAEAKTDSKTEAKSDDKTDAAKAELTETKNPEQSEAAGKGDKADSAKSEGKKSMATTETEDGSLVGDKAVGDVSSAFAKLSTAVKDSAGEPSMTMPAPGRSLEDVVRELLRPILKEWLDTHLPEIVREHVEEEVARISRGRGRA